MKTPSLAEAAAASRQALTDAYANEKTTFEERETAAGRPEMIRRAWANGNSTYTAADLTDAENNVTRTVALHEASKRAITLAREKLVNEFPDLAEAVCGALGGTLNGIPITSAVTMPDAPDSLPALFAVQTSPSVPAPDRSGSISGKVDVVLFRQPYVNDLGNIASKLERGHVFMKGQPRERSISLTDTVTRDVVSLDIRYAWAQVPVIVGEPSDHHLRLAGETIAGWVASDGQRFDAPRAGLKNGRLSGSTAERERSLHVRASDMELTRSVADDGTRTTTMLMKLVVSPGHAGVNLNALPAEVTASLDKAVDAACAPYLGRLTSATVLGSQPFQGLSTNGRIIGLELTFVSRLG